MMEKSSLDRIFGGAILAGTMLLSAAAAAQTEIPFYTLDDLGVLPGDSSSSPGGLNEFGDVVGSSTGSTTRPVLFTGPAGISELPLLPGASRGTASAINDLGQIAGVLATDLLAQNRAVRWTGDMITDIALALEREGLGVGLDSGASGINAFGDVVGSYVTGLSFTGVHAYVYSDTGGVLDITPTVDRASASDINDVGQVSGTAASQMFRWSAATGLEILGVPEGFAFSFGTAINGSGQVAGFTTSAGGNSQRFIRFTDGVGLEILGGQGEVNQALGINSLGDVVGQGRPTPGIVRGAIFIDGVGLLDLNDLLDQNVNWRVLRATDINDSREIAASATNLDTGGIHAVLLRPIGVLTPPAAPSNLVATVVTANWINLSWTDNANNEAGSVVERSDDGGPFVELFGINPPNSTTRIDNTVQEDVTYSYRVRAFNLAGDSEYSNIATVTAVVDLPPTVAFVAPSDGDTISGRRVRVRISATDDLGIARIAFSVNGALTCESAASPLTCRWDTRGLARGPYSLQAVATDISGSEAAQTITVTLK